ncbi:phosphohydrolase [Alteromonadaceae bacterium A_SAG4]|nr:phosphohydrolase [Alteromonadaceae bacterium A_SAG4]NKX05642.1 phosphohydrolase [Alteromonadaceae bacterium A_SAG6]NKX19907.1 phosphohydrolase [Alteromonadaceae bacterium A_SAG8]NKX33220.1 phosphohydrolase [Alteromonadaceae bacterium A_SAG3]NKX68475.1 phosphohydrolase [Alteromonadaceae bacterium A_SAG7]
MFKNLFFQAKAIPELSSQLDADIPRYPPFLKGLPAASPEDLQSTQDELIAKLRQVLGFNQRDFQRLIQPCIDHLAAYVHLLPASEHHHHSGAGGLLRHSLEVAFWAAQAAEGIIFVASGTPVEKKELEPRWRVAAALGGLFHDIGKPVSDLSITDEDGRYQWNPFLETLSQWTTNNSIERYFIRWRDGRCKRHEQFSILVLNRVMTPELLAWLTQPGPEILQAMLEAIGNTDPEHVLSKLVIEADQTSVQRDLKAQRISVDDNALGVPVERYLLDAMRRLLASSQWLVNQRDARVWIRKSNQTTHLYLVWKSAAKDIIELLAKDKIPGIPRDPDTLADILIERGLATKSASNERYESLAPEVLIKDGKPIWLPMLHISEADLLLSSNVPSSVRLFSKSEWEATLQTQAEPQSRSSEHPELPEASSSIEHSNSAQSPSTKPSDQDDVLRHASDVNHLQATENAPGDGCEKPNNSYDGGAISNNVNQHDAEALNLPESLAWLPEASSALVMVGEQILIRYPDAVRPWCAPRKLLAELSQLDWLELDPANPTRKARTVTTNDGVQEQGLLLKVSISKGLSVLKALSNQDAEPVSAIQNEEASQRQSRTETANAQAKEPATRAERKQKPIAPNANSSTDPKHAQRQQMVNFVKDLPILLTDGDYPDVEHSADGIRVTIQTLRQVAKEHGIPAGQLLRGISASDQCQFDEGETVLFTAHAKR